MSSEPIPNAGEVARRSRIGIFAIAGGVVGAGLALLLTIVTSREIGLIVGDMPIIAPWPFGIIVFEMTALGAILSTLLRMIIEARLVRRSPLGAYSREVALGRIVLAVDCDEENRRDQAQTIIARRGGETA
jgi:hypothetical protein